MAILLKPEWEVLGEFVSKDETRPFLTGVHVKVTENALLLEATDGGIVARFKEALPQNLPPSDFPVIAGMPAEVEGPFDVIIPAESWRKAFKQRVKYKGFTMPILGYIYFARTTEGVVFVSTNLETSSILPSRVINGQFPPTDNVYNKEEGTLRVGYKAENLARLVAAAKKLVPGSGLNDGLITFEFSKSAINGYDGEHRKDIQSPAHITIKGGETTADIMLAPMRVG